MVMVMGRAALMVVLILQQIICDFNIYADYITQPELQIFTYNSSIERVYIQDLNNTVSDLNTTLQKVNGDNKVFHSTVDTNKLRDCQNNTNRELTVSNCRLNLNAQDGGKITTFSLVTIQYDNITQTMIDIPNNSGLMILPSSVEKYFQFFDCKDSSCLEAVQLHPKYNEYNFKLFIQPDIKATYEFTLIRGYLTVQRFGNIEYFLDITQMLKVDDFFYTLNLDIFPDVFDLYTVYQVRVIGDKYKVRGLLT
jgi:hypothetical protein